MIKRMFVLGTVLLSLGMVPGCAFTGSEPGVVSHPVDGSYGDCRSCHEDGSNGAPKTDHALKDDCLSCHAVAREG